MTRLFFLVLMMLVLGEVCAQPRCGYGGEDGSMAEKKYLLCDALTHASSFRDYLLVWKSFEFDPPDVADSKRLCSIVDGVGIGCTFAARYIFVAFLHENGIRLFEPLCHPDCSREFAEAMIWPGFYRSETSYAGTAEQNHVLKKWIQKNRNLFFINEYDEVDVLATDVRQVAR